MLVIKSKNRAKATNTVDRIETFRIKTLLFGFRQIFHGEPIRRTTFVRPAGMIAVSR
jgi:hypothetical protein